MNKELLQQALDALKNSCDFVFKDTAKAHLRDSAISALEAAVCTPPVDDRCFAPIEPTLEMLVAGNEELFRASRKSALLVYRAMVAAHLKVKD